MGEETQHLDSRRVLVMLWLGVLVAPVAWFLHLMVGYVLGGYLCERNAIWALHLSTVGALVLGGLGFLAAWKIWREVGGPAGLEEGSRAGRTRFMALSGLILSGFFLLIILVAELINLFLDPCGAR